MKYTYCALLAYLAVTGTASPTPNEPRRNSHHRLPIDDGNANSIFNAVIDSMRQFGESLHHNGMSMFVAHVPKGLEFYHGNSSEVPPTGLDWLAFEPEHALFFARMQGKPKVPSSAPVGGVWEQPQHPLFPRRRHDANAGETTSSRLGYLHTYRLKSGLRLIYLDGQSAAKTTKGTMDTQEAVILDPLQAESPLNRDRGPEMCATAAERWNGRVDGFIRMEFGFEIMLCSFEKHLEVVRVDAVADGWDAPRFNQDVMNLYKTISSRYDGIGGRRVTLDFDSMISLHGYRNMVSINDAGLPRANNRSSSLEQVKADLDLLANGNYAHQTHSHDWQAIADMYVQRYSDQIQHISSGHFSDVADLRYMGVQAMRPFTNANLRDTDEEVHRCAAQHFPLGTFPADAEDSRALSMASRAVRTVALKICTTFSQMRGAESVSQTRREMRQLQHWLGWASFKRCRGCEADEVCSLPIWPLLGYKADAKQPRCRSHLEFLAGRDSYWWEPHWTD